MSRCVSSTKETLNASAASWPAMLRVTRFGVFTSVKKIDRSGQVLEAGEVDIFPIQRFSLIFMFESDIQGCEIGIGLRQ